MQVGKNKIIYSVSAANKTGLFPALEVSFSSPLKFSQIVIINPFQTSIIDIICQ